MQLKHNPPSVQVLQQSYKPIRNVNAEQRQSLSGLEKFAMWITEHIGTMGFFLIIVAWTTFWLSWNILAPAALRFDPFPAFVLWLFISNMVQIFLMPLIMIGQNLQSRHAETRADADFDVNVRSEKEIETILLHLENQNDLMVQILEHLEKTAK